MVRSKSVTVVAGALFLVLGLAPAAGSTGYYAMTGWCYSPEPPLVSKAGDIDGLDLTRIVIECPHDTFACTNFECVRDDEEWTGCRIDAEAPDLLEPFVWSQPEEYRWDGETVDGHFVAWDFDAIRDDGTCTKGILGTGI